MKSDWLNEKLLAMCAIAGLAIAAPALAQEQAAVTGETRFKAPTRLEAGGQPIKVESPGYACPTVADVDGDGRLDLVVGQFHEGHMQFFRNFSASRETPQLTPAQWLRTGKERAIVPGVW